ncbi:MAG: extracellular solute-binding protein [Pirellulaceae bacterium]|nr:extracellular solute-binding protein [Pirellulaceae bacterium]
MKKNTTRHADRQRENARSQALAWERTASEAPPRDRVPFVAALESSTVRQAEPALQWVPRQSLGTRWWRLGLSGLFSAMCFGCVPRQENEVVVYCSTDREYAAPIFDAFERIDGGTKVASQFDVESSKTLGLVTRIMQERERVRCDLFWSGEVMHTIRLQRAGLLKRRNWHLPAEWPSRYAAHDGSWVGLGARARVLLVNREKLIDASAWPKSIAELGDTKWKDQCGLAKPLYGTSATHFAVLAYQGLRSSFSADEFDGWMGKVKENAIVLSGNKQVAQAVASGELAWGLTDTDDAEIEIANGHPVVVVMPDQGDESAGVLLIPGTVAVLQNAPHPLAADALADYLASQKTEQRLTLGNAAQFALWPGSDHSIATVSESVKTMQVDFEKAADGWDELFKKLQAVFP